MQVWDGIQCEVLANGPIYRIPITSRRAGFEEYRIPIGD
jgi:hypothetical protein